MLEVRKTQIIIAYNLSVLLTVPQYTLSKYYSKLGLNGKVWYYSNTKRLLQTA